MLGWILLFTCGVISSNISVRDGASLALVDWLFKRPEWSVMGGRYRFLVARRITWEFRRLNDTAADWANKLLFLRVVNNVPMLSVESSPWDGNDFSISSPTYCE